MFGRKVLKKTVERGNAYRCVIRSVRFRRLVGLSQEKQQRLGDANFRNENTNG